MFHRGADGSVTQGTVPSWHGRIEGDPTSSPRLTTEQDNAEERFLLRLGFSKPLVAAMKTRAERNGTTIEAELLASGTVQETAYYAVLAKVLGLPFMEKIDASALADSADLDSQLASPMALRLTPEDGQRLTLIVPEAANIADLAKHIRRSETLPSVMAVATPSEITRSGRD